MRIRYIYSACIVTETPEMRMLVDPWFTPGVYDGSWYQYPRLDNPIAAIGPVDVIHITHIHPDHYDPVFLREYLHAYPDTRIVIGKHVEPFLQNKMRIDGFVPEVFETFSVGKTDCLIVANPSQGGRQMAIDTAMAVRRDGLSLVNMNDNPFDQSQVDALLAFCPNGRPNFALLPYAGAGPYPQTFIFPDEGAMMDAARKKEAQFAAQYEHYMSVLNPVKAMPFAGK